MEFIFVMFNANSYKIYCEQFEIIILCSSTKTRIGRKYEIEMNNNK